MNQTAQLALVLVAGFAGGVAGSAFFAPPASDAGDGGSSAADQAGLAGDMRDLEERMISVERASEARDLSLSVLEGHYESLASELESRTAPGAGAVGPDGEPLILDPGSIPTGAGFDAAVAAVIEQREAAEAEQRRQERAEREAERIEQRAQELAKELGLDSRQAEQLAQVMKESSEKRNEMFTEMRESGNWDREAMREGMAEIRDAEIAELSDVLSAEQLAGYQESASSDRGMMRGMGGGGNRGGGGGGNNNGGGNTRGNGF